jgi:hypothetical protein
MKKITFILFALIAGTTFAQNNATASDVNAQAQIVSPLTITASSALNFGQIARTTAGGTVILKTDASVDATSTADYISASTTTVPTFSITGESGSSYVVTVPSTDITLTRDSGSETMMVNTFTTSLTGNEGTIGTDDSFTVGATLNVGSTQAVGVYKGTFDVSVDYN